MLWEAENNDGFQCSCRKCGDASPNCVHWVLQFYKVLLFCLFWFEIQWGFSPLGFVIVCSITCHYKQEHQCGVPRISETCIDLCIRKEYQRGWSDSTAIIFMCPCRLPFWYSLNKFDSTFNFGSRGNFPLESSRTRPINSTFTLTLQCVCVCQARTWVWRGFGPRWMLQVSKSWYLTGPQQCIKKLFAATLTFHDVSPCWSHISFMLKSLRRAGVSSTFPK